MKKRNWADKALGVAIVVMIVFLVLIVVSAWYFSCLSFPRVIRDWRVISICLIWLIIWFLCATSNRHP